MYLEGSLAVRPGPIREDAPRGGEPLGSLDTAMLPDSDDNLDATEGLND